MTDRDEAQRLTTSERAYGGIALAAALLALWFLVRGGPADGAVDTAGRVPRITIQDPRPDAVLDQPVTVIFDARTALTADGTDTTASRHVHVDVGGTMLMPGAADVRPVRGTVYRWTLPRLPPGPAKLRAYWSDAAHRPIPGAPSDSVEVRIR